ncbi:MAG TPA: histidine kinase dimerization/phosphoacceptor domain-containing protein, partial [Micromonosporaceae bacterium]|nr:histidine kinase dimerization/phosphoacceptor domain-containing protein [Micromonosporaceae bacterium]
MTVRQLRRDVVAVAVLALLTVAYVRLHTGEWSYLTVDRRDVLKLGGPAVWHADLARWWTATAVGSAAMLVRGRWPLVALAGALAMTMTHLSSQFVPLLPIDLAGPVALYTVAVTSARRLVSYVALCVAAAASSVPALTTTLARPFGLWSTEALLAPVAVVLAWLLGDRTRVVRAYLEQARQRSRDLERERDRQAELAAAGERARIARELHDAVAHGLSIVVIQSQAAIGALDRDPAEARSALEAIESTGRDSLAEMRRLLGHSAADGPGLAPLPGLADLPALVDRVRGTG